MTQALNAILALCNSPTVLAEVAADDDMRTAAFRALASPLTPAVADVAVQVAVNKRKSNICMYEKSILNAYNEEEDNDDNDGDGDDGDDENIAFRSLFK